MVRASAGSSSSSHTSVTRAKAMTTPWSLTRPSGPSVLIPAEASMKRCEFSATWLRAASDSGSPRSAKTMRRSAGL